ncbi:MAG: U32 family peptidase [Ruminococcaceae bacterium]|nr:U32 family peptidase [Oscillospiraceae bacterium]
MSKIEILAPCGDMEALYSAVSSGADAVYFGLDIFNARIRAKNFTLENVGEAVRLCHAHGTKSYVTLNTQLYNRELATMLEYVGKLYESGVDALIVADFGVASLIKEYYPDFEIHASTQASVHNLNGADLLATTLGYSRVVLARELDKEGIEYISKNAVPETEIFVHGAHCMSVSGQCLASFCMGGRSGNRGECAQPCRLPYSIGKEKGYPLSLKDMSLSTHIPEILNSGAASLKIEGRMKNGAYVGGTVGIWRRLVDQNRSATKAELSTLGALFSRGGFTDGYFTNRIDKSMLGVRSDEDKEASKGVATTDFELERVKISLEAEFFLGKASKLTLKHRSKCVTVYGDIVEKAVNAPMSKSDIEKNLVKFGSTPFVVENISIEMDEGIIIRNSSINALRRQAVEEFFNTGRKAREISFVPKKADTPPAKIKTAVFNNEGQIPSNSSYFDICFVPLDRYTGNKAVNGIYLMPVVLDKEWAEVEAMLNSAKKNGVKYALVSNIGQVQRVKALGFEIMADYRFNVFNTYTLEYLLSLGFERAVISPELSLAQLRDFYGHSVIAYGKLPVMTTHKCVIKDTFGCDKCKGYIKDRQGAQLFVEGIYGHRNIIYNSVPIYMADKLADIAPYSHHFIFSDETQAKAYEVIEAYKKGLPTNLGMKRIK